LLCVAYNITQACRLWTFGGGCGAVLVQRLPAQPRGKRQGGRTLRRRVASQETDSVPLLLRHDVTGHGHRTEDVQYGRRRAQVSFYSDQ